MSTLLVGYDLNTPGQKYDDLIEFLKSHGTWCHPLDSTWLVVANKTAGQLRDDIKRHIDPNDEVLVLNVTGDNWASFNLGDKVNKWLQAYV